MTVPPGIFVNVRLTTTASNGTSFLLQITALAKSGFDNSGSGAYPPAAHVSDRDKPSILTDEGTADSSATTLLAAAKFKVSDPEIQAFIAEALNALNVIWLATHRIPFLIMEFIALFL